MAAKYLHSLADENPDLQKQIGCMNGVFHIFNRNQIVSRNRIVHHSRKKIPHGSLLFNNRTPERESSVISQRSPNLETHTNKHIMGKHRVSTESFQESFSSWSPQSYANRRRSVQEPEELSSVSPHQHLDLRDKVKDSMYREARGLPHNVLVELQDPNWYCNEPYELSRSKSCQFKDGFSVIYPRFSYDGQTTTPKQLKEVPRLSLDSKERCIRTLNSVSLVPIKTSDSKSNLNSRNFESNGGKGLNLIQTRPPSVVAKLMGLETFPGATSASDKDLDLLPKSSNDCGSIKLAKSTREPTSPCWKNPEIMKPISRVPIEAAPWKNRDVGKSASVYSEVDKRLKNLEFSESGKDLRALKRILEAMQNVEVKKGERDNTVDHQKPPFESVSQESKIVIMKPGKSTEKGFINNNNNNNKVGKDQVTSTDSFKPRKQFESKRHTSNSTQEKSTDIVKVDESVTPEYPSPVSVLDDSIYMNNSPSPLKKHTPNSRKDHATQNLAENLTKDQYKATNDLISSVTSQINREKLQKVAHLVQKLKRLNSTHNEAHTDYIASLLSENTNTNPNNRYISEIFLASGLLLRDLESFQFHSSVHPINPDLFLVLERTKFGDSQKEKCRRKLIFDAVNEILVKKLDSGSLIVQNPRELLRGVCLEIEGMQAEKKGDEDEDELKMILREDVMRRSENWAGFYGGSGVVAVEVEWLIFRDLVNEVVMSEGVNSCY